MARAGAVIGRCFVPDVLPGSWTSRPTRSTSRSRNWSTMRVLWPPGERGLYDFRHQLLRDAIYRSLPVGDRRRFHARAAEFGAALEGQSEIHASLHFERAGLRRQAFQTARAGAEEAARLSAHREAFELYRRVVANMPADLPPAERGTILHGAFVEAFSIEEDDAAARFADAAAEAFRERRRAAPGPPDACRAVRTGPPRAARRRRTGRPSSRRCSPSSTDPGLGVRPRTRGARRYRGLSVDGCGRPPWTHAGPDPARVGSHLGDRLGIRDFTEFADWSDRRHRRHRRGCRGRPGGHRADRDRRGTRRRANRPGSVRIAMPGTWRCSRWTIPSPSRC